MSSMVFIVLGLVMLWVGITGRTENVKTAISQGSSTGYADIPLSRFVMGMVGAAIPLVLMDNPKWQWRYITLIVVSIIIVNYKSIQKFSQDLGSVTTNKTQSGSTGTTSPNNSTNTGGNNAQSVA